MPAWPEDSATRIKEAAEKVVLAPREDETAETRPAHEVHDDGKDARESAQGFRDDAKDARGSTHGFRDDAKDARGSTHGFHDDEKGSRASAHAVRDGEKVAGWLTHVVRDDEKGSRRSPAEVRDGEKVAGGSPAEVRDGEKVAGRSPAEGIDGEKVAGRSVRPVREGEKVAGRSPAEGRDGAGVGRQVLPRGRAPVGRMTGRVVVGNAGDCLVPPFCPGPCVPVRPVALWAPVARRRVRRRARRACPSGPREHLVGARKDRRPGANRAAICYLKTACVAGAYGTGSAHR